MGETPGIGRSIGKAECFPRTIYRSGNRGKDVAFR